MKTNNQKKLLVVYIILSIIFLTEKVSAYGDFGGGFTITLAFILGVFSLFTPCVVALLPAYFSTILKENRNLISMVLIFALGLASVLLPIGIAASFFGNFFMSYTDKFLIAVGLFLIIMGIFSLLGKSFSSGFLKKSKFRSDPIGVYLFGIVFGVSGLLISPCNGPVVLGITALLFTASAPLAILTFTSYILGIIFPLLILSYYFDQKKTVTRIKTEIKFNLFGRKIEVSIPRFISGLIFIAIGGAMLKYRSTVFLANIFFKIGIGSPVLFVQEIGRNFFIQIASIIGIFIAVLILYYWIKKRNRCWKKSF